MAIVASNGLYKTFQQTTAVSNIDLSINKGEIFGIIGPDGAGKTTLLRLLTGILRPDRGSIQLCGIDIAASPEAIKEKIGVVPQNFSLYPDLTVDENLSFFGQIYQIPRSDFHERRQKLLQITRLEQFTRRRAEKLSGGMQKKLALMCSLLHTPEVLILDEPTTGVDPISRRELWDFLYELLAGGITIIVSTPYMDEAERCSRVGFLYQGELLLVSTPNEVKLGYPYSLYEVELKTGDVTALVQDLRAQKESIVDAYPVARTIHMVVQKDGQHAVEKLLAARPEHPDFRQMAPNFEDVFISVIRGKNASA
ncbi:MAG TPA: ABC transporter ATP-binding protein [bacterium]